MEYVTVIVIIALAEYLFFMAAVGKARGQCEIKAPATIGNETFERYFRVQQNTIEQLIVFIPAIYLCGYFLHDLGAAILGVFFIVGRALYFKAYVNEPAKRGPGMIIGYFATVLLLLGALVGVIRSLL